MFKTLATAWKLPDLRRKMLFTVMILVLFRLGCVIQVPFISLVEDAQQSAQSGLFQYFDILSGQAFSQGTLFALSVSPYITASIVIQLLTIAIPALERLQKSGEEGQKKINMITRYITIALALVTSYGYYITIKNSTGLPIELTDDGIFPMFVIIACHCAGAAIIMWMGEKITEHGIGNGISMILFVNIVSSLPTMASSFVSYVATYSELDMIADLGVIIAIYAAMLVVAIGIVAFVCFFTESERRLPVQYAKRVVGRKMYGGQSTHLPLKMNMTGVMPIIFASTIISLPSTIQMFFPDLKEGFWYEFFRFFSADNWTYPVLMCLLIVAFAYFYQSISFNPMEVANNLKKNGGFIPGIRPGKPTSDFIKKSLNKITLIGAFFLGIVALIPMLVGLLGISFGTVTFGGTSLLILVGVIIEVRTQLESQITMRHFKGFLE